MAFEEEGLETLDDYATVEEGGPAGTVMQPHTPTTYKELTLDDFKPVELAKSGKPVRQPAQSRRRGRPARPKFAQDQFLAALPPEARQTAKAAMFLGNVDRMMGGPQLRAVTKNAQQAQAREDERARIISEVKAQRLKEEQAALANAPWYERAKINLATGASKTGASLLQLSENLATAGIGSGAPGLPNVGLAQAARAKRQEIEQNIAREEEIDPSDAGYYTRGVGSLGTQLPLVLGSAAVAGPILGPTLFTGASADWERDPVGSALQTATAGVPVVAGKAISPYAARLAKLVPGGRIAQKAAQVGVEGAAGAAANVGQYAGSQALLGRKIDPREFAFQGATGGVLSGMFSPNLETAARAPIPTKASIEQSLVDKGIIEPPRPVNPRTGRMFTPEEMKLLEMIGPSPFEGEPPREFPLTEYVKRMFRPQNYQAPDVRPRDPVTGLPLGPPRLREQIRKAEAERRNVERGGGEAFEPYRESALQKLGADGEQILRDVREAVTNPKPGKVQAYRNAWRRIKEAGVTNLELSALARREEYGRALYPEVPREWREGGYPAPGTKGALLSRSTGTRLSMNPFFDPDAWINLGGDIADFFRMRVRGNEDKLKALNRAPSLGVKQSNIDYSGVRAFIEQNPNASPEEIAKFADTQQPDIFPQVRPQDLSYLDFRPNSTARRVNFWWRDAPIGVAFKHPIHHGRQENVLFDAQLEDRETTAGEKGTLVSSLQSDWFQGKGTPERGVPEGTKAPFKSDWLSRGFQYVIADARARGLDGIFIPKTREQVIKIQKWKDFPTEGTKDLSGVDFAPVLRRYLEDFPKELGKIGKAGGVGLEPRTLQTADGPQEVWFLPINKEGRKGYASWWDDALQSMGFGMPKSPFPGEEIYEGFNLVKGEPGSGKAPILVLPDSALTAMVGFKSGGFNTKVGTLDSLLANAHKQLPLDVYAQLASSFHFLTRAASENGSPSVALINSIRPDLYEAVVQHETLHGGQQSLAEMAGLDDISEIHGSDWALAHPVLNAWQGTEFGKIVARTGPQGVAPMDILAVELPAYVAGGSYAQLGIPIADALDYTIDYVINAINRHGVAAIDKLAQVATLRPGMAEAIELGKSFYESQQSAIRGAGSPEGVKEFTNASPGSAEATGARNAGGGYKSATEGDVGRVEPAGSEPTRGIDQEKWQQAMRSNFAMGREYQPTMADVKQFFTPGNVVPSYGGWDRVIDFQERPDFGFSVKVIEIDPQTGEPKQFARPRNHSTVPSGTNFLAWRDMNREASGNDIWEGDSRGGFRAMGPRGEMLALPYGKGQFEVFVNDTPIGIFPTEMAAKEAAEGVNRYSEPTLYSNPMFDPAAYKRFLGPLFKRSKQEQPLTEAQKAELDPEDPNYEINLQRSQNQTRAQQAIDEAMSAATTADRTAQQTTTEEYKRSVQARSQARRRLQNLEAMRDMPEFLDPVRKADLEAAIELAKADREATLESGREARGKMKLANAVAQKARAQAMGETAGARLKDTEANYRVDPEVPYTEEILNPGKATLLRAFFRTAKDAMLSQGLLLDPNEYVTPQVINWAREGKMPLDHLIPVIEEQGMSIDKFFDNISETLSLGGMSQREASQLRLAHNQMVAADPTLAKEMEKFIPKLRDINKLFRERSNLDRFVSINSGMLTSLFETAMRNLGSSGIVIGMDTMGQVFDSAVQYTFGSKAFDNKATLSPTLAMRPMFNLIGELARSLAARDFEKNSGRVSRTMAAFEQAFPKEVQEPLVSIMNSDDEMAKLNGFESTPELLARWKAEAEALPETYKKKPKLLAAIGKAEKRYADLQSPLARGLIRGEKLTHALNIFNRAQETIARRAVFEAKVRRYATEAGYDIDAMVKDGTIGEIPPEIVKRATDDALRLTVAKRPERPKKEGGAFEKTSVTNDSLYYLHRGLTKGPIGAAVKLGFVPFVNFLGNFVKFAYDYSPAGLIGSPIFSARERARIGKGDLSVFWKGMTGIALYGMFSQMRHDHYEAQGSQMSEDEEPWYQKYPRKPWAAIGTPLKAGEKWYEVNIGGRNIDLRFTPFGPAALLADMQERNRRGLGQIETRDIIGALGGSMRGAEQLGDTIGASIQGIREAEKATDAGKIAGKWLGTITAGFLTPLKYVSDLSQAFGAEGEKIKRDVNQAEGFAGSFAGPVQERIPFLRQYLPEQEIPTREAPPVRSDALKRQVTGLPFIEEKNFLEQQMDTLGIKPFEIVPRTGNPKADRIINRNMGVFMEGVSDSLSKDKDFKNLRAEERRMVLMDIIFPAFYNTLMKSTLEEVPEVMLKSIITRSFTKEMRNVEDRRRKREGQPSLSEEIKQSVKPQPSPSPNIPPRPVYTPAPQLR